MRVLFVSNLYPPNVIGGYERLCFEVASAFVSKGHDVSVLTSDFGQARKDFPGQHIHRSLRLLIGPSIYEPFAGDADARAAINSSNISALHDTLAFERPDLVFSWNLFFLDRSFLDSMADAGLPVVVMLTDNWLANMVRPDFVAAFFHNHVFGDAPFPTPPASPAPAPKVPLRRRIFGRPIQPVDLKPLHAVKAFAIFGSDFMRSFYREAGFRFADGRVIHNGVVQCLSGETRFRDRAGLVEPGCLRLLFAGRLVDLKGADTAVAALDRLTSNLVGPLQIRLTIVGDEQDAVYIKRLNDSIGRSMSGHEIVMQPIVPEHALFDLFEDHDIYLFPSLYEPFSLTLIHALACGIPTIASDAGGNVEIVHSDRSGLLFGKGDPDDLARAIARLATDGALRVTVSQGGRDIAKRFDFAKMIAGMEALLDEVVEL